MDIQPLALQGVPDAQRALRDGKQLFDRYQRYLDELRTALDDDASKLGFDPTQPLLFNETVDMNGSRTVRKLRANKNAILALEKEDVALVKAIETLWDEMGGSQDRDQPPTQVPETLISDVLNFIVSTTLRADHQGTGEAQDGVTGPRGLTSLFRDFIGSTAVRDLRRKDDGREDIVNPASQYEPVLMEKLKKLQDAAAENEKNARDTIQGLTDELDRKRNEAERLGTEKQRLQQRTHDLEAVQTTFDNAKKEWELEKERLEKAVDDNSAIYDELKRVLDADTGATDDTETEDEQPAAAVAGRQEPPENLPKHLTTALEQKNEATTRLQQAEKALEAKEQLLNARDKTVETQQETLAKLAKDVSELGEALKERDSLVKDVRAEKDQAADDRLYYHNCLIQVTVSEALHKEFVENLEKQVADLEEARDGYKAEAAQLRNDLETEKQTHDRDMKGLREQNEQEVSSITDKHKKRKRKYKSEVARLQQLIDDLETARDTATETHESEVTAMRQERETMIQDHWSAIETEKSLHNKNKEELEKSHDREKEQYKTQLANAKAETDALKNEHANAISDRKAEHRRELTSQTETHQAAVGEFEQEIRRLKSEGQTLVDGKTATENTLAEEKRETALKALRITDLENTLAEEKRQTELKALRITDLENTLAEEKRQTELKASRITTLENTLAEEKRQTALKASRITTLESQLTEATLGDTEKGNRLRQVERDLEAANSSHAHALEQWTRLFFGPVAVHGEDTLKTAIAGGTHAATQDHRPWVVGEFWKVSQQECEFSGHSISTIVPMLVQALEEKGFEVSRFHGMMRQLTKLVSCAPQVNTALLAWVVECCNRVVSARQEDLIPSQAAVWALTDVLVSRWPDTGLVDCRPSDVVRECWDLIQQPDAHEGVSPMLKIQQGDNDLYLIRKQGWYWAVLMDMQERICYFLKPECMVPIGPLGLDLHLKAGTIDVQLKLGLREVWTFYMKNWSLKN
ncbi:Laminin subunit alpha-2 [Colletotrichum sp. SAR 10_76]|nr:Laminin subunit alpha-2 [Colletotrichum sp. SAR 10_76]